MKLVLNLMSIELAQVSQLLLLVGLLCYSMKATGQKNCKLHFREIVVFLEYSCKN